MLAEPEAARQVPEIDEVIAYDAPWTARAQGRRERDDWSLSHRRRGLQQLESALDEMPVEAENAVDAVLAREMDD